ncbi:MAG: hypothetical protein IH901_07860 [Proteobacteria bacterium]|nr:hypothetical protein [Pseudomonadota bacterium]
MFDNIMNAAKGFFPDRLISFAVAGLVISALYQLVGGGGFDPMEMAKFAVTAAVAGFFASLVMGAAE